MMNSVLGASSSESLVKEVQEELINEHETLSGGFEKNTFGGALHADTLVGNLDGCNLGISRGTAQLKGLPRVRLHQKQQGAGASDTGPHELDDLIGTVDADVLQAGMFP